MAIDPGTAMLASAAISGGASALSNKLGGGGSDATARDFITPFKAGGFSGRFGNASKGQNPGKFFLTSTPERQGIIDYMKGTLLDSSAALEGARGGFQGAFGFGSNAYGKLLEDVRPGFGRLTDALTQSINNAKDKLTGNLSAELRRRRMEGSGFGNASIASAALAFEQQAEEAITNSFLAEMDMTNQLLDQKLKFDLEGLQADLDLQLKSLDALFQSGQLQIDEFDKQAEVAIAATKGVSASLSSARAVDAEIAAMNAQGYGAFGAEVGDALTQYMLDNQQPSSSGSSNLPTYSFATGSGNDLSTYTLGTPTS